jgi:hypothetical protein
VIFYFIIQIKRDKSKNMLMLIIIKKYEKVIKRDKKKKEWLPTTVAWHFHCQT